jgi:uncharacterized protein (TIGR02444 family)
MMKAPAQAATPFVSYSTKSRKFHRAAIMRHPGGEDDSDGDAFWRFSLALYARPGVAGALIRLQDEAARDVNVILFGLWLGVRQGRLLAAGELADAEAAIAPIVASAVAPLRRLRRELKARVTLDPDPDPDIEALRRRIAGLEIAAERRVQYRLAAHASRISGATPEEDRLAAAEANLALYLGAAAPSPEAGVLRRALAALTRRAERSPDAPG